MAVWAVIAVLAAGAVVATVAARRHTHDVEPTVREFAEFRDAISRQVAGVHADTAATRRHVDSRPLHPASGPTGTLGQGAGSPPFQG